MLQNPESEKPRSVAAQGVHAAFDKFLDVQGVTGSSPVSSTRTKALNRNRFRAFCYSDEKMNRKDFPNGRKSCRFRDFGEKKKHLLHGQLQPVRGVLFYLCTISSVYRPFAAWGNMALVAFSSLHPWLPAGLPHGRFVLLPASSSAYGTLLRSPSGIARALLLSGWLAGCSHMVVSTFFKRFQRFVYKVRGFLRWKRCASTGSIQRSCFKGKRSRCRIFVLQRPLFCGFSSCNSSAVPDALLRCWRP